MRESKVHRASGSGWGKPSAIMHIGFFACFQGISLERSRFLFIIQAHVVLKPLVSLIGRLVACSARTDRQTDKPTTVTLAVHACWGLIKTNYLVTFRPQQHNSYFSNTYLLLFFHKRANMVGAHVFWDQFLVFMESCPCQLQQKNNLCVTV